MIISVIIPTYNRAKLVGRAIKSVLAQTYTDLELIICDDGSTDNTKEVVKSFSDKRIIYHYQKNSGTPAGGRNGGIKFAKGEWISFLDSDDVWYSEKMSHVVEAIRRNPDAILISHNERINYENGESKIATYGPWCEEMYEQLLYEETWGLSPSAVTIRTDIVKRLGGFDTRKEYLAVEDYDFWLRLTRANYGTFLFLPVVLGEYFYHQGSLSNSGYQHIIREINMLNDHLKSYEKSAYLSERGKSKLAIYYHRLGIQYHRAGLLKESRKCCNILLKMNSLDVRLWILNILALIGIRR